MMSIDNKLGREYPSRIEFEKKGSVMCDGIIVEGVKNILIDYCDDEITLQDEDNLVVGTIYVIAKRECCVFLEPKGLDFNEHVIIRNGEVVFEGV